MIELGIAYGGSVAFLALAARPAKFVAIDIDDQPVESLARLIESRRLGESVRPMYGIDQADRGRLREIVRDEFGDSELDIVIDDASHQYEQTAVSFETLFPYLRPGGEYIIENWSCDHWIGRLLTESLGDPSLPTHEWATNLMDGTAPAPRDDQRPLGTVAAELLGAVRRYPDETLPHPLSRLALELVLVDAESGDTLESVVIDDEWIVIKRGRGELPDTFRLSDVCIDRFNSLA